MPELRGRDRRFERITLRHLLTMRSGLRYQESGTPWSDDTATYYAPDLRALALERTEIAEAPGRRFHYNNRDLTASGGWLIGAGLVAFVVFAVFSRLSSGSEATGAGHPAAMSWRPC